MKRFTLKVIFGFIICSATVVLFSVCAVSLEPLGPVLDPGPAHPAIIVRGGCFTLRLTGPADGLAARIVSKYATAALAVRKLGTDPDGWTREWRPAAAATAFSACVPEGARAGLYDIAVTRDEKTFVSRRAVKVLESFRKDYYFVHIADLHVGANSNFAEYGWPDTGTVVRRALDEIARANPEFLLIGGDVITSGIDMTYYENRIFGTAAEKEMEWFLAELDRLEIPTFIVPGNHDNLDTVVDLPRDFWEQYVGPRFYSFDYGGAHFTALDNSGMMEATSFLYGNGKYLPRVLSPGQREWLEADLEASAAAHLKVLLFHVPVHDEAPECVVAPLAQKYGVRLALFGHHHWDVAQEINGTLWVQTRSVLDTGNYRLVRVSGDRIVSFSHKKDIAQKTPRVTIEQLRYSSVQHAVEPRYSIAAGSFNSRIEYTAGGARAKVKIENATYERFERARFVVELTGKGRCTVRAEGAAVDSQAASEDGDADCAVIFPVEPRSKSEFDVWLE